MKDIAGSRELIRKAVYPGVQRRDRYLPVAAEFIDTAGTGKIRFKYGINKAGSIRAIRDKDFRKNGVCGTAAPALYPGNNNLSYNTTAVNRKDHHSGIRANLNEVRFF